MGWSMNTMDMVPRFRDVTVSTSCWGVWLPYRKITCSGDFICVPKAAMGCR